MIARLFIAWLVAVQVTPAPRPIETRHLTVTLSTGPMAAGKLPLYVDVMPRETMHVYAPGQPGYVAIELKLDADAPVTASGKPKYPAAGKLFMKALNETQLVYSRPFRITQDVRLRGDAPEGTLTVRGMLRYQACDDAICYKPVLVPLAWTVPRN